MSMSEPEVSVVIPIYNEEGILQSAVVDLHQSLIDLGVNGFEIILSENGSTDATISVAERLGHRFSEVRTLSSNEPNYGKALKRGILEARGTYVFCDEIDLCDEDFYRRALVRLRDEGYDMVVGSKLLESSFDKRGWYRHTASRVINTMLKWSTGFKGTDTHGLKAFRRETVLPVVERCQVDRDLFASELVIRAERTRAIRKTEIPLFVAEKRPPSINLVKRVPRVLKNMVQLTYVIRIKR